MTSIQKDQAKLALKKKEYGRLNEDSISERNDGDFTLNQKVTNLAVYISDKTFHTTFSTNPYENSNLHERCKAV
jgi:hypothetical protein